MTAREVLSSPRLHLALLVLFAGAVFLSQLGGNGLAAYDDCFYAQKAKEVLSSGSWMTLHYNGRPEFSNPPFFIWLVALSFSALGVTELAAKLPSALMGVLTVVLLYYLARTLFDEWTAFLSGFVLSTTTIFTRYGRHAMMDVTLSFFFCLAIFALLLALRRDRRLWLLWGLAISLCVLIKSVLGFFPAVVTVAFLLLTKRWKTFVDPYFVIGCALVGTLGMSWYYHQLATFGAEFFDFHFGWVILARGLDADIEVAHGFGSYAKWIFSYYWPWIPFMLLGLYRLDRRLRRGDEIALLLFLWVGLVYVTMALMRSRVVWYIMPIFPALAMIVGQTLNEITSARWKQGIAAAVAVLTLLAMPLLGLSIVPLESEREVDVRAFAPIVRELADQGAEVIGYDAVYHRINNPLLFYSDIAAEPVYGEREPVLEAMAGEGLVLCVVTASEVESLTSEADDLFVVHAGQDLSLVANRPVK